MNIFILYVTRELQNGFNTFPYRAYKCADDAYINAEILTAKDEDVSISVQLAQSNVYNSSHDVEVVTCWKDIPIPVGVFSDKTKARNYANSIGQKQYTTIDSLTLM
tara:strand:+ start:32856 stop:33173 length:318 start_codon:yes stop_codon:yes gene_type:complete